MDDTIQFLIQYGYIVLTVGVFAEQIGLPIPSLPFLLGAGALAGTGRMNLGAALLLALAATLVSDVIWYEIGRRRGAKVLNFLCRISLEPDSCVRRTEGIFSKHGAKSLLVSKFVPGLNTVAPPLAGIFHMRLPRFLLFDTLGALVWAGSFLGAGYIFSDQIERIAGRMAEFGAWFGFILVGGLALYIGWKFYGRRKFLHDLRIARITPDELKRIIDAGQAPVIVDLRHSVDFEADPMSIPGALRMEAERAEGAAASLPRDRDIILYCT